MAVVNWRHTLNLPLFSPTATLSKAVREGIITNLWPSNIALTKSVDDFDAYFVYYNEQCSHQNQVDHVATTQLDIVDIAQHINSNAASTLNDLRTSLHRAHPRFPYDLALLGNSIELTARLWLMINVQNTRPGGYRTTLHTAWPWPDNSSLADVVQNLRRQAPSGATSTQRFAEEFNCFDLGRIGGFRIVWTEDLSYHLHLEGKVIYLYYHVSVLGRMRLSIAITLLPTELFNETLDSLALLLPKTSADCNSWLTKQCYKKHLDPDIRILAAAPRAVQSYDYWRQSLLTLSEAFDRSQPTTVSQWWHDRRNIVQWWTFWVAFVVFVLTVFFGLLSSVTGIVQAWASIKGLNQS